MLPAHERVSVGNLTLHVARWPAAAPPLLLLPAMTQTWRDWLPVVPFLAPHFDIAAVDLRGHGDSDKPTAGYGMTAYAADVVALATAIGWVGARRPLVIGHSLGGTVAQVAEAAHPSWARRVVIEDTPLQCERHDPRVVLLARAYLRMYARPREEAAAHFRRVHPDWSAAAVAAATDASRQTAPAVLREYLAHRPLSVGETLHGMHCPVLLVYGDTASGGFVSEEDAATYLAALPHGRAVQIAGAGHSLHVRKPAEFAAAVLPFLRGEG